MELATVPNETGFDGLVNAEQWIILYNREGESIRVAADKEAYWLTLGFSRKAQDVPSLVSEITALAAAVGAPWQDYATACQTSGFIDSAAQEVAIHALTLLSEACNNLHLALHTIYRTKGTDE